MGKELVTLTRTSAQGTLGLDEDTSRARKVDAMNMASDRVDINLPIERDILQPEEKLSQ